MKINIQFQRNVWFERSLEIINTNLLQFFRILLENTILYNAV